MRKLYMKFLWAYKTTARCRSHSSRAAARRRRRKRGRSIGIGIPCVYLTGTEQTDQDIVGHAMTGYAEFSRDNAAGHAFVCACPCVCVCVRVCVCLFGRLQAAICELEIMSDIVASCQQATREGERREGTDVRSSLWAGLSSFLLATFGIAHTPRVLPICNVACLSGPTAMALPCSMPHAPCPHSIYGCCSMLAMSFIALHFCRLMPLACLSVCGGATKLCAD